MQSGSPTGILTKEIKRIKIHKFLWSEFYLFFHFRKENGSDPVEFFDWKQGQPDDLGGVQNCLHIKVNYGYQWDDFNCNAYSEGSNPFKPLCQKKL